MTAPPFRVLLAAALVLLAALSGCAATVVSLGTDDNKIELELDKLLADHGANLWKDVGTVVYRGRVLLLGGVQTADAKARAGAIAATPEGVIEVINDIQVADPGAPGGGPGGGPGAFRNDVAIEKSIRVEYRLAEGIESAHLRVRSVDGTVYLIGLVETRAELDKALEIARATGEVVKVVNYVRVIEATGSCGCKKRPAPKRKPKS